VREERLELAAQIRIAGALGVEECLAGGPVKVGGPQQQLAQPRE
jgi:hypothetical protein